MLLFFFFFSSRRRHTRYWRDWSSDVCSSDLRCKDSGTMVERSPLLIFRLVCHRQPSKKSVALISESSFNVFDSQCDVLWGD